MSRSSWNYAIRHAINASVLWSLPFDEEEREKSDSVLRADALQIALARGLPLVSGNFDGAALAGCDLRNADLTRCSLRGADLRHCQLDGALLYGADLENADLSHASLMGAQLCGASAIAALVVGADLRGANLSGAALARAQFQGALLAGTRLCGADCYQTSFCDCDIASASFSGVDLSHAIMMGSRWDEIDLERWPIRLEGLDYTVTLLKDHMVIGSSIISLEDLSRMDDRAAAELGGLRAMRFFRAFRSILLSLFACEPLVSRMPSGMQEKTTLVAGNEETYR